MVSKQFDVNIGIGVAVEGIDQKSIENAKQKIKKALNNTDAQVKLDIDPSSMKEFNATITALKKNIATLSFKGANGSLKEFIVNLKTGSVQAYDSAREAAAKYADRLIKLQSELSKFKTVTPVDDKATKNIKRTQKAIEDLKKSMKANLPDDLYRNILNTFDKTVLSIEEVKSRTGEASKRFITLANDGQNVTRVIQQWDSSIGQFVTKTVETTSEFKTAQEQVDSLAQKIKSMMTTNVTNAGFVSEMQGYLDQLKQVNVYSTEATQKIQSIANAVQNTSDKYRTEQQILDQYTGVVNEYFRLLTSLEKLNAKNSTNGLTSAEAEYQQSLRTTVEMLRERLNILNEVLKKMGLEADATQIYTNTQNRANMEADNFRRGLIQNNSLLGRFTSGVSDYFNRFLSYTLVVSAFNAIRDAMRSTIDVAEKMNAVFTDIQMVSLSSAESIDKLKEAYAELAYEYSSSVISVAEGANQWIRQGKSASETTELLRASMVLSRVGAIDAADATEYLTSTLNGYQLEASEAMRVVDAMSQADIESASSVEDLAIALQKTANIARNSGVEFETLVGWIAEVKEVTQRSAATIGESFKTILSRLGSVKAGTFLSTDLEAEYQDLDSFINDTEKVLSKVGISLRDTNKDFRDAEDVINDVATSWKNYSDLEKNAIATAIAGTRQRENFTVLMDNFGRATDLATSALNSQGSAMEKYNIYADSIAGTTERITALWQDFVNRVDIESVLKGLLDLLEQIAKVLNNDVVAFFVKFGTLPALFAIITAVMKSTGTAIIGYTANVTAAGAATAAFSPHIVAIAAVIGLVVTAIGQVVSSYKTWDEKLEDTTSKIRELENELDTLKDSIEENKEKIKELMSLKEERQLTIVEAEELENLIKENEELERQKTLNDIILEQKKQQAQIEAENAFAGSSVYIGQQTKTVSGRYGGVKQSYSARGNYAEGLMYQVDRYKEAQEQMNKYAEEGNEYRYEMEKEKAEDAMGLIEEYKEKMETIQDNLPEDSPYLDEIKESFDYLINQLGSVDEKFNNIWNNTDFEDITNDLYEMAKSGELAASTLGSPKYAEFKNKIDAAGISVEDFVGYVYGLIETADDAATSVNNLGVETQTYSTIIDAIQPKIDAITQAQKDMSDQGYLSIDTIKDLETEFGDLTGVLQLTANGYIITTDKLQDLSEAALAQYNIELQNAQTAAEEVLGAEYLKQSGYDDTVESILTLLEATRALYAVEAKKLLLEPNIDYKKVFEYSQLIGEIAKSENDIRTAQENLDRAEHLLDTGLREGTTTSSSSTSDETKEVELAESAYEKLNRDLEYNLELSKQRRQMYEDTEQMDKWQEEAKVQGEILNQLQEAAHEEADRLRKENEDIVAQYGDNITNEMRNIISENEKTIQDLSQSWWDWEQEKRDLAKETADYLEELAEKEAEEYEKMIEGKIDALEDEIDGLEDTKDKANDLLDELNEAIDREIESRQEALDDLNDSLDAQITKWEAIKELTSTYFDITNDIEEERRNINTQLRVSKESYKYLTDELRETIFNEKDYKVLSDKLNDIADSSAQLYEQYLSELEGLTEDEIWKAEQITTEFQNQYELKEMEFNIAKAELEVVKAQTELQNVKANRNVRMYKDGKWIWTYDFEAAADAEQQLADAENKLENEKIKLKQEQVLQHYDNIIADLNAQKQIAQQEFDAFREYWGQIQESFEEPVRSINEILDEINSNSIPGFKDSVDGVAVTVENVGESLTNFITQIEETIEALEAQKDALESAKSSSSSGGGGGGTGGGWSGGTVSGSTPGSIIDGKVTATIDGIGGGDVPLEYNPETGKITSSGLKPGDIVHTQGGDFQITGGTAGNYESIKVNKSYDSGGILNGMGNIKATDKDEVVFGPDITSKILSPEKSREFLSVANALSSMLDNSSALANVMRAIIGGAKINQQAPSMTDSHDIYLPSGFMSSMTQNDQSTISSIIRRYIPITQGG